MRTIISRISLLLVMAVALISPSLGSIASAVTAPTANFTATNDWTVGNAESWYPTTFTTLIANKSVSNATITYYLNGVQKGQNTKINNVDGFQVDATKLTNGAYKLTATIQANGVTGKVKAYDGTDNLRFTVKNVSTPTAQFTATDGGTFGNGTGAFSTTVSTLVINKSSDLSKIEYYLNDKLVGTNLKVGNSDGYTVDATTLSNGTYKLKAKLLSSSGGSGQATTMSGASYLTFYVKNTEKTSSAPPASSNQTSCAARQSAIDIIAARIIKRSETHIDILQSVEASLEQYIANHPELSGKYLTATEKLNSDDQKIQNAMLNLITNSVITCNSEGKPDLSKFKAAAEEVRKAMATYRKDLYQLVQDLEKQ